VLIFPFAHAGLALATSLGSDLNAFLFNRWQGLSTVERQVVFCVASDGGKHINGNWFRLLDRY